MMLTGRLPQFLVFAFLLGVSIPDASADDAIRWHDERVGSLSFVAPSGPSWTREQIAGGLSFTQVERGPSGAPKRIRYVRVLRNEVGGYLADWTEEEVADDFRDMEEQGMQTMGVQTGMYSLLSIVRGKERHSGRKLYTMKNVMRAERDLGWRLQLQKLYLIFPNNFEDERDFYIILIGDFCAANRCNESDLSVDALLPILDQLQFEAE